MSEVRLFDPKWKPTDKEMIEILRWLFKSKNYDYIFGRFRKEWVDHKNYPEEKTLSNKEWADAVYDETIKPTLGGSP